MVRKKLTKKAKDKVKTEEKVGVVLVTNNNNGIFNTEINAKGKEVHTLAWEDCSLSIDGKIVSYDVTPVFQGWTERDYIERLKEDRSILFLEPMSAHEDTEYLKRNELKDFEIAEMKMDGHRGTIHIGEHTNRVFSRRISSKTDWYNENTDQVPHIRDLTLRGFYGTVLDGEFDFGTTSMGVQSVMGSLPANAIQYQFNNRFIDFFAFDILYYKGINIQKLPLYKRKVYLLEVIMEFQKVYGNCHMEFTKMYAHKDSYLSLLSLWMKETEELAYALEEHLVQVKDYKTLMTEVLEEEKEGLMIKDIFSIYEQKKTKNMIKLKGTSTWDCVMMGILESTRIYEGKDVKNWKYWESTFDGELINAPMYEDYKNGGDLVPVTKPYFMGWCGKIEFGVWSEFNAIDIDVRSNGGYDYLDYVEDLRSSGQLLEKDGLTFELVKVGDCKGLTEAIQIDLKENWQKYVQEKRVVEVKANGIIDKEKGSLRHPRFAKWRDDKDHTVCNFDDHIRVLNE